MVRPVTDEQFAELLAVQSRALERIAKALEILAETHSRPMIRLTDRGVVAEPPMPAVVAMAPKRKL